MLAGYGLGRLCEGYFIRRFGFSIFVWRRFDSLSRLITARRNPNMILLGLGWLAGRPDIGLLAVVLWTLASRSEEHTSELQSLMRISYAVFCLKKKNIIITA